MIRLGYVKQDFKDALLQHGELVDYGRIEKKKRRTLINVFPGF